MRFVAEGANEGTVFAPSPGGVVPTTELGAEGHRKVRDVADHDRPASVVAETIVQCLFKIGLELARLSELATSPEQRGKTEKAMLHADIAINEVRNAVFIRARSS
jgi:hypothetical protein